MISVFYLRTRPPGGVRDSIAGASKADHCSLVPCPLLASRASETQQTDFMNNRGQASTGRSFHRMD
jgi:hypothetical protein